MEHPVWCGYVPAFDVHATLAGMLSPMLTGDQVVEVRESGEKRLLTAVWMVKRFHHKEFRFPTPPKDIFQAFFL